MLSLILAVAQPAISEAEQSDSLGPQQLLNLPIEQLMEIEVTSVAKKPQRLGDAAAAAFVITREDIRRSGANSIAELLRMVPGLDVAQADSRHWAVSARGLNDIYSTKLLVLVDGRTIYSPFFAGVFWEAQNVPLEDIDHIEVIRGPGGTIWGVNAVNGVINIITRHAQDTQGPAARIGGGGGEEGSVLVQYGGQLSDAAHFRIYGAASSHAAFETPAGGDAGDSWRDIRLGSRLDWSASPKDRIQVQAGYYRLRNEDLLYLPSLVGPPTATHAVQRHSGGHALAAWDHQFSPGSDLELQAYYDEAFTREYLGAITIHTYDLDVRHRIRLGRRHELVWGGGYRRIDYATQAVPTLSLIEPAGGQEIFNIFAQDDFAATPALHLIGGIKLEHTPYTGWENEPSLRLAWTPSARRTLWAAVSRAIRTPSIAEEFLRFDLAATPGSAVTPPVLARIVGDPGRGQSERMISWEVGYRDALAPNLSLDVSGFYSRYDRLSSNQADAPTFEADPPPPHLAVAVRQGNLIKGETHGAEVSLNWQVTGRWRLFGGYSLLLGKLSSAGPPLDPSLQRSVIGLSPRHQAQLRSYLDLPGRTELDAAFYYVGAVPAASAPAYTRLDLRLGWKPTERIAFSVSGRNLLRERHREFLPIYYGAATEVPRTVYVTVAAGF